MTSIDHSISRYLKLGHRIDPGSMDRLLDLPAELRLEIYKYAVCDQLFEIDMSEYWRGEDPKFWERIGEPLAKADPALACDIKALHRSRVAICYTEHMRASLSTSDQKVVFWLFNHADAVRNVVGYLRFSKISQFDRHNPHLFDCDHVVEIDFSSGDLSITNRDCHPTFRDPHMSAIRESMSAILNQMPRCRGRFQPRLSDLWDLYEAWRLRFMVKPPYPRSWNNVRVEYSKVFRCPVDPKTKLVATKSVRDDIWDLQQVLLLEATDAIA